MEEEAKNEASKLLNLLKDHGEWQRLRQEREFTLEKLQEERGITIQDCKKLFTYGKVYFEMGEYKCKLSIFNTKQRLRSISLH